MMKKLIFPTCLMAFCIVMASCNDSKLNTPDAITPTYKENSTGTGANPNIGNVTVTGSATLTNPATQNSALQVGGTGWSFDACVINGNVLTAHLAGTSTDVTLTFGTAPTAGSYSLTNTAPSGSLCRLVVNNAPGQPGGITWYSKSGLVTVTTNTTATPTIINASFCNVQCLQQTFLFPVVTACGYLVCQ